MAAAVNPESGVGLGAGLVVGLAVGRLVKDLLRPRLPLPRSVTHRSSAGLGAGLVGGLLGGIVAGSFHRGSGPAAGLINGVMTAIALGLVVGTGRTEPARGPRLSRRGLYVGAIVGLVVAMGIAARTAHGFGLAVSIVAGIIALVVIGLVAILSGTPADLKTYRSTLCPCLGSLDLLTVRLVRRLRRRPYGVRRSTRIQWHRCRVRRASASRSSRPPGDDSDWRTYISPSPANSPGA